MTDMASIHAVPFGGRRQMTAGNISDYDRLIRKMDRLSEFEAREKLLMEFIDTHEPGEDTAKVEVKLQESKPVPETLSYLQQVVRKNGIGTYQTSAS